MNLWATTYEHQRTAWGYAGGGPGSGIHQSTDGGKTWKRVTGNGLPRGTLGRIALDICKTNPNVIYAQIEAAPDKETGAALDQPAAARRGRRRQRGGARRWRRAAAAVAAAVRGGGAARSRPIRSRTASGARSTRARRGRSCPTRTSVRCTSARSASIRTTRTRSTSAASTRRSPPTAARRSCRFAAWATSTTTRSGSIR